MSMDVTEWQQIKGWVDEALAEARLGLAEGGIPIGSVLADPRSGEVVARGHNLRVQERIGKILLCDKEKIIVTKPNKSQNSDKRRDSHRGIGNWQNSQKKQ